MKTGCPQRQEGQVCGGWRRGCPQKIEEVADTGGKKVYRGLTVEDEKNPKAVEKNVNQHKLSDLTRSKKRRGKKGLILPSWLM